MRIIRRALLLSLGEFDETRLPSAKRAVLLDELLQLYRSDPDAGIHAAAAWLFRRWGGAAQHLELDDDSRGEEAALDGRRWYTNSQGQTMVVVEGPVEFSMGSPGDEPGRHATEIMHRRRIDRSFAIAALEVSVDQLKRWRRTSTIRPTPRRATVPRTR